MENFCPSFSFGRLRAGARIKNKENFCPSTSLGTGGMVPLAVEGQGGGSLRAHVPAGTAVSLDDVAILPGIVGGRSAVVSRVEHADGESFVTLYFSLPVNVSSLRFVEVWKQTTHVTQ